MTGDFPKICISLTFIVLTHGSDRVICKTSTDKNSNASIFMLVCSMFSLLFGVIKRMAVDVLATVAADTRTKQDQPDSTKVYDWSESDVLAALNGDITADQRQLLEHALQSFGRGDPRYERLVQRVTAPERS